MFKKKKQNEDLADLDYTVSDKHEEEKSQFAELLDTLKLNKHYRLERKIAYIGVAGFFLATGLSWSTYNAFNYAHEQALKTVSYDTEISFTKTSNAEMKINKVYLTKNRKRAYISFTFTNLNNLSVRAKNYFTFIQAAQGSSTEMSYHATGQFILFGNTGNGCFVIDTPDKITNEPVTIILRNDKNLRTDDAVQSANDSASNSTLGANAQKYDLLYFKVNLGATNVTKVDGLDGDINGVKLYSELFAEPERKTVEKQNADLEKKIKIAEAQIKELRYRLSKAGYVLPDNPKWLSDSWRPYDVVSAKTGLLKDGRQSTDVLSDGSVDDPDNISYPNDLDRKDNNGTLLTNPTADSDSSTYSKLQDYWNQVKAYKRKIYVDNNKQLAKINAEQNDQKTAISIGSPSRFVQLSKVK